MQRHSLTNKTKGRETFSIEIAVTILFAVKSCSTNFIYNIVHSIFLPLKQAFSLFLSVL